jgi:serine/threonine-protein kinase
MLEVSEIEEINIGTDPSLLHGHVSSNITASSQPRRSGLTLVLALAVLCGLLFVGWRLIEQSDSARLAAPASVPSPQQAAPAPVSTPPTVQQTEVTKEEATPSLAPSASGDAKRPRAAKSAPPPRKVVAPAAPAPVAAPPRNCTPPYVLDAEGVKTYKPECL